MVDSQRSFDSSKAAPDHGMCCSVISTADRDSRHGRHPCCPPCLCRQQDGHGSDHNAAAQTDGTHLKNRRCSKLAADTITQCRANTPADKRTEQNAHRYCCFAPVERLQTYKADDLLFAHTNAAHHTEKLRSLGNIAVHTARNHQRSCQQHQHKQHCCDTVNIFHGITVALSRNPHHSNIL